MTHLRDRTFGNMRFDYNAVAGGFQGNCDPAGVELWAGILFAGARALQTSFIAKRKQISRRGLSCAGYRTCAGHEADRGQVSDAGNKQFRLTRHHEIPDETSSMVATSIDSHCRSPPDCHV